MNAPERIYVNPAWSFSWGAEKVHLNEIEYIRSDIHEEKIKALEADRGKWIQEFRRLREYVGQFEPFKTWEENT